MQFCDVKYRFLTEYINVNLHKQKNLCKLSVSKRRLTTMRLKWIQVEPAAGEV